LWDFGGQAIYHNAHRLFMSSGAVFLVLWNPRPRSTPATDGAYADTPRPLPYWIEMIRMGCPGARIAVVCNVERTAEEKAAIGADGGLADDLQRRYRAEYDQALAGIADRPELLLCDAEDVAMVQAHVIPWLDQTIGDVVRVQGATVPAHWEIAEEMVGTWLREAEKAQAEGRPDPRPTITVAEFRDQLVGAIDRKLASDGSDRWKKLALNWNQGAMLTVDRVERVLGFLTDSGLVFWNQEHLEDVVIVGQQWALEGVYAMLERRTDTEERRTVYRRMTDDPTFTAKSIGELLWNQKGYSAEQQKILLRFMEQMKLCFRLRNDEDAWSGEGRFVSVQHLKPDQEKRLAANFAMEYGSSAQTVSEAIEIPSLHQTRWEHALAWLGTTYGGDARYARDAFLLDRNDDGQTVLVTCAIDASGIGGRIKVWVAGHTADRQKNQETCADLLKRVGKECSAESTESERRENRGGDLPAGPTDKVSQVFISYSWNPPSHEESFFDSADRFPLDYEQPVIELCKALKERLGPSALIWDRDYIGLTTRISDFVSRAKAGSLFIVCHSDRYWRRAYCMYELLKAYEECGRRADLSFESHFAFVGFCDCDCLDDSDKRRDHVNAWKARTPKVPVAIEDALKMTKDELIDKVTVLVGYNLGLMTDVVGSGTPANKKLNRFGARFGASQTDAIADWICERLARNVAGRESRARHRS
ncbi:MAG: hypothetical protein EBX39_10805, partial [Actinobacteria bacterium]|nr:hypothetical protein [Actinomycetota bacterium]